MFEDIELVGIPTKMRKAWPGARGAERLRTREGSGTVGESEQPGAVVVCAQQRHYRHGPLFTINAYSKLLIEASANN